MQNHDQPVLVEPSLLAGLGFLMPGSSSAVTGKGVGGGLLLFDCRTIRVIHIRFISRSVGWLQLNTDVTSVAFRRC